MCKIYVGGEEGRKEGRAVFDERNEVVCCSEEREE